MHSRALPRRRVKAASGRQAGSLAAGCIDVKVVKFDHCERERERERVGRNRSTALQNTCAFDSESGAGRGRADR